MPLRSLWKRSSGSPPATMRRSVRRVRDLVNGLRAAADGELPARLDDLRVQRPSAERTRQTFALATEAVRRVTGKTYYDVQLTAGLVLADGDLAEMQTGEGKTLVTLLPVLAAAADGEPVHVATTNSYLAARDFEEVAPALELLGVRAALLPEENDPRAKAAAYAADVTYGTGYEFGFDYLRDELSLRERPADRLGDRWLRTIGEADAGGVSRIQPRRAVTVVDEIDSVLIDEANTPLVIGLNVTDGAGEDAPYRRAAAAAARLKDGVDFEVRPGGTSLTLTDAGRRRVDHETAMQPLAGLLRPWRVYVEQALRARLILHRGVDYVVRDGQVALVDQNTGRVFAERKWRDGLHQAVELKEGVALSPETQTVARVSRQTFFQCYPARTGLTGTAVDAEAEFRGVFGLRTVPIPLNRPSRRATHQPRVFTCEEAKFGAIAADAGRRHGAGQPVLIGTRTIGQSQRLSDVLSEAGVPHQVLNGVQDADEADLVSRAGEPGIVTVATNMAGRGTDIRPPQASLEAGGLHVIGAEFHRSRRVDRQLAGRTARQGQPGSCQFFAAADDELLVSVESSLVKTLRSGGSAAGEHRGDWRRAIRAAQSRAERADFQSRQEMMRQEIWNERVLQTLVGRKPAA